MSDGRTKGRGSDFVPPSDGSMFIVSGTISALRTAAGHGTNAIAGIAGAIEGMYGSVANAAMLSMYDGEGVEKFVFQIDGFDILGNFEQVGFADGERIEAVVTKIDDRTLFAHAVVRMSDGLLWMPYSIDKGRHALAWSIVKSGAIAGLLCWLVGMIMFYFIASGITEAFVYIAKVLAFGFLFLTTLMEVGVYRSSAADGLYAEKILSALGFKNPKIVNLRPFCLALASRGEDFPSSSYQVYKLKDALAAYNSLV